MALFRRPPESAETPAAQADEPSSDHAVAPSGDEAFEDKLLKETGRTRAAARARKEGEERRVRSGFEPFPLRMSGLTLIEVVEEARRMREASRRLREAAEERRVRSADDALAPPSP